MVVPGCHANPRSPLPTAPALNDHYPVWTPLYRQETEVLRENHEGGLKPRWSPGCPSVPLGDCRACLTSLTKREEPLAQTLRVSQPRDCLPPSAITNRMFHAELGHFTGAQACTTQT